MNNDEISALDSILTYIPYRDNFKVQDIYCIRILQPLYPREGGGTDLAKYDPAHRSLSEQGFFKNINQYLIENNFAVIADPLKRFTKIVDNGLSQKRVQNKQANINRKEKIWQKKAKKGYSLCMIYRP